MLSYKCYGNRIHFFQVHIKWGQKCYEVTSELALSMEDGGVIESRQNQMGQMANFPPLLSSSFFDSEKHAVPQIDSQIMRHGLMNLVNTTLF